MRFLRPQGYAAVAVVALHHVHVHVPVDAWTLPLTTTRRSNSLLLPTNQQQQWTRSLCSSSASASLMMEGEVGSTSSSSSSGASDAVEGETLVAKGSVVSFFRGGLAAVRIDDANIQSAVAGVTTLGRIPDELQMMAKSTDSGGDLAGRLAKFPNGQMGVIVAHRPPIAFVYGEIDNLDKDSKVSVFAELATRPIWNQTTVTRWDGQPIVRDKTATPPLTSINDRAIFSPIPQVKDIDLINNPMLTGNTMVDVLAPIGRGQNMLLIADDLAAARGMMTDFIATQKANTTAPVQFVYAAIDNSEDVLTRLQSAGLLGHVHVVASTKAASSTADEASWAAEATAIASSACAIAESYAMQGQHTVVIVDTLDLHKKLWDSTTRTLVDVFGVESVVRSDREGGASSEMRGFFSAIVQRSGQYKKSRGGGSLTLVMICELPKMHADESTMYSIQDFEGTNEKIVARINLLVNKGIPLTAANLRKLQIPIPSDAEGKRRLVLQHIDDLISMSDGQIWLDEVLREAGQCPPLDPQKSITRVGIGADTDSRADAPAFRRIAEGLRLILSQAANMEGAEVTSASEKQARTKNALLLAMHQQEGQGGRTLADSCVALLAASRGLLDHAVSSGKLAGTEAGQELVEHMLRHVKNAAPNAMLEINRDLDIKEEARLELVAALEAFFQAN